MSHKFHGKGSGRKKTEKRLKRRLEEFVSCIGIVPIPTSWLFVTDTCVTSVIMVTADNMVVLLSQFSGAPCRTC